MIKTINREMKYTTSLEPVFMHALETFEARSAHEHQLPVIWDKALNFNVWDMWGNKYLDFTSGIFVTNCGHSNPNIRFEISKQLSSSLTFSYNFPTKVRANLLTRLIDITPDFCEKAFLLTTGAEAVECAIKLMKLYTNKSYINSFYGSMHGKTMLAEQLKGRTEKNKWAFGALSNIFQLCFPSKNEKFTFGDMQGLNDWKGLIGGIIIESYQGWSGRFYPKKYIQDLCKWAKENNILVCFDEIQAGFGRTGKLFAYEHYEIEPDLITIAKAFGNGMPISAVVGRKEILDVADDLSSTQSGNPICCASALATINYLSENKLIEKSANLGCYLSAKLNEFKTLFPELITEVNSKGLLGAIIFKDKDIAKKVCYNAMKRGLLLVYTGRESIKIGPPLTITLGALLEGLKVIKTSIKEFKNDKKY